MLGSEFLFTVDTLEAFAKARFRTPEPTRQNEHAFSRPFFYKACVCIRLCWLQGDRLQRGHLNFST
jgi:hypothetical protein